MLNVEVIATTELGDRSYVAHDGTTALAVDPQRDVERVESVLAARGLSLALVLETHVHNDYVSGGLELARRTGATYVLHAHDELDFERRPVSDGDELSAGSLTVRVVATPGHTDHHLSYVVSGDEGPPVVFTGGSLLYGSVGRTDLQDPNRTTELTRAQYHSARRLAADLPEETAVYPTHGFGSFCSSGSSAGGETSTIGLERTRNDALTEDDEDTFVSRLVAGLTAYPAYYAHMAPLNRAGAPAADLSPAEQVDPAELGRRIAGGEWVIDLRDRTAYAADHVAGTVSIALGDQFSTYVGWLLPWGAPLTLVGASEEDVAEAQRQLVRIGIERPAGAAVGAPADLAGGRATQSFPRATFADLADLPPGDVVLDVRRDDERGEQYVPGSAHVPIHDLLHRQDDVPGGRLWVHCASGYRATIAASLLARAGRDVVLVDDDFDQAVAAGLTTTR